MKVEVKENKEQERKYPYLGKAKGNNVDIVLFLDKNKGVYLEGSCCYAVWNESEFTPFNGSITLSND